MERPLNSSSVSVSRGRQCSNSYKVASSLQLVTSVPREPEYSSFGLFTRSSAPFSSPTVLPVYHSVPVPNPSLSVPEPPLIMRYTSALTVIGLLLSDGPTAQAQEDCAMAAVYAPFATVTCYYDWYNSNGRNFLNYVGKFSTKQEKRAERNASSQQRQSASAAHPRGSRAGATASWTTSWASAVRARRCRCRASRTT